MAMHRLGKDDHGTTVRAAVGDLVTIALPSNPTTGYRWVAAGADEDSAEALESGFSPGGGGIGGGGEQLVQLNVARPGRRRIELVYRRPWEESVKDRFAVTVEAEGDA
jgi:inhibitor of cysteine peptidase